jgi:XapX domain-containing protein
MLKMSAAIILCLAIGAACRWFDIPVPSPPKLAGVLLVLAMTIGYMAADRIMAVRFSSRGPGTNRELCGGPTGEIIARGRASVSVAGKGDR